MPVRAYVNNNGRLDYTRQYNPSAGYVSGTDPLGEFVVGNAVLNKPLQLVGRATEYGLAKAGNKWARVISKTIDKGTPLVEPLPNNVGWGPRQSIHDTDTDAPTKLTLYNPERWDAVYEGAPELVHYMYRPSKEQEAELAYNVRQYFKRPEGRDYFRQSRATEQTARGTQIKNYYGLNEGTQDITPAMWEYARRNYVKDTGINNNMTEWLNSVDERDIIAFTKWLSKHSPAIAAPLIGGTLYDDK